MHIWLTVNGKRFNVEVEDNTRTIDLKIHGETCQVLLDAGMTVYVMTSSGKKISVKVHAYETIKELKAKCEKKVGTLVEKMQLIYAGIRLVDDRNLARYNIRHESIIYLA